MLSFSREKTTLSISGSALAAVVEQSRRAVARLALAGIGLAVEVGVAFEHHATVGIVLGQHVRAGADRIPVERQVLFAHSRLRVETIDLARHRREKRHRQPIDELRVLAEQRDAQRRGGRRRSLPRAQSGRGRARRRRAGSSPPACSVSPSSLRPTMCCAIMPKIGECKRGCASRLIS